MPASLVYVIFVADDTQIIDKVGFSDILGVTFLVSSIALALGINIYDSLKKGTNR